MNDQHSAPEPSVSAENVTPGQRCPLSGIVVTAIPHNDWVEGKPYRCHACGALVTYRIRESDHAGGGRLHTHKAPRLSPAPTNEESDRG